MSGNRQYLERRHNAWHVVVEIPKTLRAKAGQKRFKRSLGTDSLAEANRRKWPCVADFKRRIAALANDHGNKEETDVFDEALRQRHSYEHTSDYLSPEAEAEGLWSNREHVLDEIRDKARELAQDDPALAERYYSVATGAATFIRQTSTSWFAERVGNVRASVLDQQRAVINRFLDWAGEHASIEETTRRKAGAYVTFLRSPASGIETTTARRHVSALSALWRWLIERGLTENNPWRGHSWPKATKRRSGFTDEALVALLTGTPDPRSRYRHILHDLIRLALVTGARLEELCGLRCEDVAWRNDSWWLLIREYEGHRLKSSAATREVPLHDSAAHVVERLRHDEQRFLFPDLTPGGPDNRRSWNVSRSFAAYRRRVGVKARGEVFHALRNTFVEHMEGAGVPESTVKLLVGHARPSLTFGRYSEGARVDLREAINRLAYTERVAGLIAQHGMNTRDTEQSKTDARNRTYRR